MKNLARIWNSFGEANRRLWRRSKLMWLLGLGVIVCTCCTGFVALLPPPPREPSTSRPTVVSQSAEGTATALLVQAGAQVIETENAQILAAWTATQRASGFIPTPVLPPASTQVPTFDLTATPLPTQIPRTETPEPTSTVFTIVVTSTPTDTPIPIPTAVPTNTPLPVPVIEPTQVVPPATRILPSAPAPLPMQPAAGQVVITFILYDGVVPRIESDEYAEIKNLSPSPVDLTGWRLNAGDPGQDFRFPNGFILQPDQSCRVYTNEVHPETCGFSYGSRQARWNNDGDCGALYNQEGAMVSQKCY